MKEIQEERRRIAEELALSTGELAKCENCGDTIRGNGLHVEAIAKGMRMFKAGEYEGIFSSKEDVQEEVFTTINDYPSDDCVRCSLDSKN